MIYVTMRLPLIRLIINTDFAPTDLLSVNFGFSDYALFDFLLVDVSILSFARIIILVTVLAWVGSVWFPTDINGCKIKVISNYV